MKEAYIVYLNKTYDVWARDAYTWAEKNNIPATENNVISEPVFWMYIERGLLENVPVYFCKDIQDDRKPWTSPKYINQ